MSTGQFDTQVREFEVQKHANTQKTEDATATIEPHPDYQRTIHLKCEETRREAKVGIEGTKRRPEAVPLTGTIPEWAKPMLNDLGIREIRQS